MKRSLIVAQKCLMSCILALALVPTVPALAAPAADGSEQPAVQQELSVEADASSEPEAKAPEVEATSGSSSLSGLSSESGNLKSGVGFVYVDVAELQAGDVQTIAIVLDDESVVATGASLVYTDSSGATYVVDSSTCAENAALFEFPVQEAGVYRLTSASFRVEGEDEPIIIDLTEGSNVACSFTVVDFGTSAQARTEDVVDVSVFALSEDGELEQSASIDEAIAALAASEAAPLTARSANAFSARGSSSPTGDFVVALDPGHGAWDPGASANGLVESDLNWKIANYCKTALESYTGVSVYLTRSESECPDLSVRVQRAVDHGARVFVSLHINSAGASANGVEVWYPNNSPWKNELHTEGGELAGKILAKLVALGLTDRGTKVQDYFAPQDDPDYSDPSGYYPDGSESDYYGVIRYARQAGIPGIIVEHAFVTNDHDANLLRQDWFLKQLGEADAAGIAEAYGLQTGSSWELVNGRWCYKQNGVYAKSMWVKVNGDWYWFDGEGYAATGWTGIGGVWYYFDDDCTMHTGWLEEGGYLYRLASSGAMETGWFTVDGVDYQADGGGRVMTGWVSDGWNWHYYDPYAATSWKIIDDTWYCFDGSGIMLTGWYSDGYRWYFLNGSGVMQTGWVSDGSHWYWCDGSGVMQTGWIEVDGKRYLLNSSGVLQTGWYSDYYHWYYLNGSGVMQTGIVEVDGVRYGFDGAGVLQTGWYSDGYRWYHLNGSGAVETGWYSDYYHWYWLDPTTGVMQTGWVSDGSHWYWCDGSGVMQTGWHSDGLHWYFLNGSGIMQTGWVLVDGALEYFDDSGRWVEDKRQEPVAIMGASNVDAASMVSAFSRSGHAYPSSDLVAGGAATIDDFCRILYEESVSEGVKPEVVFCQAMIETGWLDFGGDVSIGQFNFAGLGATGGGATGNTFADVRTGLRAQVQHLKAYAAKDALNNPCVDERFAYVARGCAPYVQWLGIQENPQGFGWATGKNYGVNIVNLIHQYFNV